MSTKNEMRVYSVTIPIAGHLFVEVEAESAEQAIAKAHEDYDPKDAQWETLDRFNSGNVCYCPSPWEIQVEDMGPAE